MSTAEPARAQGRRTRDRILTSAVALYSTRGYDQVSVAEIAAGAGAYPNQITYHFGSKDSVYVHVAFRMLLRDAARLEPVGRRQRTPEAFRQALGRTALALPAVPVAVHALSITRVRPELHALAEQSLGLLFHQAERYLKEIMARRGWVVDRPPAIEARTFWSAVLGARLISESGFGGRSDDVDLPGVLTVREAAPFTGPGTPPESHRCTSGR